MDSEERERFERNRMIGREERSELMKRDYGLRNRIDREISDGSKGNEWFEKCHAV